MPQRKAGIKDLKQNRKRHLHNLDIKTDLKKTTKKFLSLVNNKDKEQAEKDLKIVYKKLDKAAKKNVLNKNTASRRKSHFTKLLKNLA